MLGIMTNEAWSLSSELYVSSTDARSHFYYRKLCYCLVHKHFMYKGIDSVEKYLSSQKLAELVVLAKVSFDIEFCAKIIFNKSRP